MALTFDAVDDLWRSLGERLRIARERRGWSQTTLAQRMGVARNTIVRLEAGDPSARLNTLGAALRAMDLDIGPLEQLADPAADRVALSREIARSTRKPTAPSDPRDDFDFGSG